MNEVFIEKIPRNISHSRNLKFEKTIIFRYENFHFYEMITKR